MRSRTSRSVAASCSTSCACSAPLGEVALEVDGQRFDDLGMVAVLGGLVHDRLRLVRLGPRVIDEAVELLHVLLLLGDVVAKCSLALGRLVLCAVERIARFVCFVGYRFMGALGGFDGLLGLGYAARASETLRSTSSLVVGRAFSASRSWAQAAISSSSSPTGRNRPRCWRMGCAPARASLR